MDTVKMKKFIEEVNKLDFDDYDIVIDFIKMIDKDFYNEYIEYIKEEEIKEMGGIENYNSYMEWVEGGMIEK